MSRAQELFQRCIKGCDSFIEGFAFRCDCAYHKAVVTVSALRILRDYVTVYEKHKQRVLHLVVGKHSHVSVKNLAATLACKALCTRIVCLLVLSQTTSFGN
jgi:hypothetical protein